jgi:hypothetical protein
MHRAASLTRGGNPEHIQGRWDAWIQASEKRQDAQGASTPAPQWVICRWHQNCSVSNAGCWDMGLGNGGDGASPLSQMGRRGFRASTVKKARRARNANRSRFAPIGRQGMKHRHFDEAAAEQG